jgi:hypothetical protein
MSDSGDHDSAAGRRLLLTRLGVGLVQGLVLFGLSEAAEQKVWPAADRPLFIALVIMALGVGPVVLSGLGALKRRTLIAWTAVAAVMTAAIGWVEGYRRLDGFETIPSPLVMVAVLVGLFVAHSLVVAAARDHRRIATYPTYFDLAWKHGVQLALALAFTGIFWGVLALGAALFGMIGVRGFAQLIGERWFAIPASALAFAAAVHLTDVRLGLIQGVRTVALTLLGWLLPLLAGLTLAFLVALPFTGLKPLWNTGSAAMILIGAGASLILLINAAYQDGGREKPLPLALRWAMRLAGVLLVPLTALAAYALWLRIGQYGLTIERIIAVAGVVVGACYAVGYAIAAVLPGSVMRRLEPTNVTTSFVGLAVLLALLSPVADPVRLSVDSQVARLRSGQVKPADFDFEYLTFSSGRFGETALASLAKDQGEVGRFARLVQAQKFAGAAKPLPERQQPVAGIKVWPAGHAMPETLKAQWPALVGEECSKDHDPCEVFMVDLNDDGREEALIKSYTYELSLLEADGDSGWVRRGVVDVAYCSGVDQTWQALRAGTFKTPPSRWRDLEVNGLVLNVDPGSACPPKPSAEPPVHQRR